MMGGEDSRRGATVGEGAATKTGVRAASAVVVLLCAGIDGAGNVPSVCGAVSRKLVSAGNGVSVMGVDGDVGMDSLGEDAVSKEGESITVGSVGTGSVGVATIRVGIAWVGVGVVDGVASKEAEGMTVGRVGDGRVLVAILGGLAWSAVGV